MIFRVIRGYEIMPSSPAATTTTKLGFVVSFNSNDMPTYPKFSQVRKKSAFVLVSLPGFTLNIRLTCWAVKNRYWHSNGLITKTRKHDDAAASNSVSTADRIRVNTTYCTPTFHSDTMNWSSTVTRTCFKFWNFNCVYTTIKHWDWDWFFEDSSIECIKAG